MVPHLSHLFCRLVPYFNQYGQGQVPSIDTGCWSMWILWHTGHLINDISPELKYEAHQKHEGHNRKSTCLSIAFEILSTFSLPPSKANKVFFLRMACSLSINIWRFTSVKHCRLCKTLLTLSYLVNHAFNTSLFVELWLRLRRSDSTCLCSASFHGWFSCGFPLVRF